MVPKGRLGQTSVMITEPRRQIRRRDRATGRLRSMTTGIAIAGVAGTAGFGLIAATSWSGNPTPVAAADGAAADATPVVPNTTAPPDPADQSQPFGAGQGTPVPVATPAPRVQKSRGSSHATTGGSAP
jgi:hypothetical protein